MTQLPIRIAVLFLITIAVRFSQANEEEYVPVAARGTGEICRDENGSTNSYSLEKMFDRQPETFAAIQDESRNGNNPNQDPPFGALPITTSFVVDMGQSVHAEGIRFVSRPTLMTTSVKNVSVFACDDPEGTVNCRPVAENQELPPTNSGYSACLTWPGTESRYWLVQIHDAYALRTITTGGWPLPRRDVGQITPGQITPGHLNVQIAELRLLHHADQATGSVMRNANNEAFPEWRLEFDWMLQDHGQNVNECFSSAEKNDVEKSMVEKVLSELPDAESAPFRKRLDQLLTDNRPGSASEWKQLYREACTVRRQERLSILLEETREVIYVKHCVFGGKAGLTGMPQVTDEQFLDLPSEVRGGSQLCRITFHEDGSLQHEVLLDRPEGVIRDVNLSFDAKTLIFAMRDSLNDNYHLYTLTLNDGILRQVTFDPDPDIEGRQFGCVDFEPCFTPDGRILFASTRHTQINCCWPNANTDLFICDMQGNHIRRLTYDELDVNFPQILNDGRVLYTRWEYSDRNAFYLHPLMTMNPDGTMQTEFCGNNSMFPSSYIQARAIPDSTKVIAIISGHHTCHKGKLALVDRTLGTQDGKGIEFVAGASPDGTPGRKKSTIQTEGFYSYEIDYFGQDGPQYRNPFALDEEHYLVSYCPEGWANSLIGPFLPPFGLYYMTADGQRELLAFDWAISTGASVAVLEREVPPVKPDQVDLAGNFGTYLVQDVYFGPGLEGIERGVIKKLRVVALEYRAGWMGKGSNAGEVASGLVQTPVSFNNGTWDVKHVLGEVEVETDGSCKFEVPARTPVYFQLLDEKGYCVQTMRSWSTLQGGETFACLGCHEDKLDTGQMQEQRLTSIAATRPAQKLQSCAGKTHPLIERLAKECCLDSIENYWGINAPETNVEPDAPTAGFSYRRNIQPILDRHCIECHTGDTKNADPKKASPLALTGEYTSIDEMKTEGDDDHKRAFTRSYLALTKNGFAQNNPYIQWIEVRSRSEMLPPYHTGSARSPLMNYLEPEHYGVSVSEDEKRTIACWIDLLIPFCGSYPEANRWTESEKAEYRRCIDKRRFFAQEELNDVRKQNEP